MIATRHHHWEARLAETLAAWAGRAHRPRPGEDCVAFVLAAVAAVAGFAPLDIAPGVYRSVAGQGRYLKRLGWRSLPDAADDLLGARIPPLAAHRGDIVTDGQVLGVMTGRGPVAFGEQGLSGMTGLVAAWPVGRADNQPDAERADG